MIVVTGSSGHLGEALVRTLREAGGDVRGLDIVASPFTDVVGSITDREVVGETLRGAHTVLHAATLHKPHVTSHSRQEFVDVNISGTLALLDAAVAEGVTAFVYTSTTSAFGDALVPPPGAPATWIDESVVPVPKNIYGVTKVAAEDLCALAHRNQGLPVVVLRTSRFFPEADDEPTRRHAFADDNLKANELLYRRADIEDIVSAHLCAIERACSIGFGRYIISATTPFVRDDRAELARDAAAVVSRRVPGWRALYDERGWRLPSTIERVYDNARARAELGWQPRHDFASMLRGGEVRSPLARAIGVKGYGARTTLPGQ